MVTKRQQSLHEKEFRSREKRFTAASIQGEIRVPPSLEHAEINVQFVGTYRSTQRWPRSLCHGTNLPWISLRAASRLCHFIPKIQFERSPKLTWARPLKSALWFPKELVCEMEEEAGGHTSSATDGVYCGRIMQNRAVIRLLLPTQAW